MIGRVVDEQSEHLALPAVFVGHDGAHRLILMLSEPNPKPNRESGELGKGLIQ